MSTKSNFNQNMSGDLRSKLIDGLGGSVLLLLLLAVLIGMIIAVRNAGAVGIVSLTVILIILTWFFLKCSLNENLSDVLKAWYGIISSMTAWTVLELGELLGLAGIECKDGTHLIILAAIFTLLLWKYFPLGPRFFIFVFFLNWAGHILIKLQEYLGTFWAVFDITLTFYSWAALILAVFTIIWIFVKSETRIQRLYAAGWLYLFTFTFIHMIFMS